MKKGNLFLTNLIGLLIVVALIGGGVYFYYEQTNYIKTEDAQVTGDIISIASPASGVVKDWKAAEGTDFDANSTVGKLTVQSADGVSDESVKAPSKGTVIKDKVHDGETVTAGETLAQVVDMDNLYIVANIEETNIDDVKVGADVDVTVDAQKNTTLKGKVEEVGYATNSVFSLLSSSSTSGNYTKVTQRIPVKISLEDKSADILPGMNAEISISK